VKSKIQIKIRLDIIRNIIKFVDRIFCMIILKNSPDVISEERIKIIQQIEQEYDWSVLVLNVTNHFLEFNFKEFKNPNFFSDYISKNLENRIVNLERTLKEFMSKFLNSSKNEENDKNEKLLGKKKKKNTRDEEGN